MKRVSIAAIIAKKLATVMISTSRFAMCESSWARTPSTSFGSSRSHRPVVTHTAACLGERPVAKAFGTGVSIIATFGFGRSAMAQQALDHVVQRRCLLAADDLAPGAASASLSEVKYWKRAIATMITIIGATPTSGELDQGDAEDDVEEPEQAAREEHPNREAGVAAVRPAFHGVDCRECDGRADADLTAPQRRAPL